MWETLWNKKHPNQLGSACEGEDTGLMAAWREQVRAMISKCGFTKLFEGALR